MAAKYGRIKKDAEIKKIFQTGKTVAGRFIFLKIRKTQNKECRPCFVVGLKVSKKATERNRTKRRLRSIFSKICASLNCSCDIAIVAKREILSQSFLKIKEDVEKALIKSGILK